MRGRLGAHLLADEPHEARGLVVAERDVALEPRVGDGLRGRPEATGAALLVGEAAEAAGVRLCQIGIKVAMRREGLAPLRVC